MSDADKVDILLARIAELQAFLTLLSARQDQIEAEQRRLDNDEYWRPEATPPPATATASDTRELDFDHNAPPVVRLYQWSDLA